MKMLVEWHAPEHHHIEKTSDWYWAVGILSVTAVAIAIILGNYLFAILLAVSAFAICVHAAKAPRIIRCVITDKGVVVHDTLYPYMTLESYAVDTFGHTPKLLLKSKKLFVPYVVVIIHEVEYDLVERALRGYLKEGEHVEPVSVRFMEYLGF